MILEAVWLKNGKEIYLVDPAWQVENNDDAGTLDTIRVFNGYYWYSAKDCDEEPDDFIVRVKKDG